MIISTINNGGDDCKLLMLLPIYNGKHINQLYTYPNQSAVIMIW